MKEKFRYVEPENRKKILLLCDDIRVSSGVGNMAKEIVAGTAHHFNWVNVGAAVKHPDQGKVFDVSPDIDKVAGIDNSSVKIYPNSGYGDMSLLRRMIDLENPDAILIFTDPRYWAWLFDAEREVRSKIPIFYLNIWDNYPAPMYNRPYYQSVDLLMAISKQTKLINETVLGEEAKDKIIKYVPHGINQKHFFPIDKSSEDAATLQAFRREIFGDKEYEFVLLYNSRNIRRKNTSTTMMAYKIFCDMIGPEKAAKTAFILKTEKSSPHGTDLEAVRNQLFGDEHNIYFLEQKISTPQMNLLYNVADATILLSGNEGWGLALTESISTATPIIATVTGGMQDQMCFLDENAKWIEFSEDFPSNHKGRYKNSGPWAFPVFPQAQTLVGSPTTPYIYDDIVTDIDAANQILKVYNMSAEERSEAGELGRQWIQSDEARMTAEKMCQNVIESCDEAFDNFKPRKSFELTKIEELPKLKVTHKLYDY